MWTWICFFPTLGLNSPHLINGWELGQDVLTSAVAEPPRRGGYGEPRGGVWGSSAFRPSWGVQWHQPNPFPPSSGQIVKKSCYPRWNETFEFELEEGATEVLCVETWDWDLVSRNDFLGKVSTTPHLQCPPAPGSIAATHPQGPPSSFPREGHSGSLGLLPTFCQNQQLPPTATGTQGPLEGAPPH